MLLKSNENIVQMSGSFGQNTHRFSRCCGEQTHFNPNFCNYLGMQILNSLTPISILAGTKNSLSEDFLLAKHKDTNIPTMMEPFSSPAAWF